ncbi:secretion/conjugation apparatus DotM-related subunit [Chromobacterium sp. CV08]|uniref:secretion/conjugation apparatus DotM-related subunit n=1 Tax=Chromobacterium sp. CV08 TaxID=3133274 RepID=UPI003DA902BA
MAARNGGGGSGGGDDRLFLVIGVLALAAAAVYFAPHLWLKWMQSTYGRYLLLAKIPLLGVPFAHGAEWLREQPTMARTIALDYALGWLAALPAAPLLLRHIRRERAVRRVWSNRPANRKMFDRVIRARGLEPKERQLYQVSEWMTLNGLDHEAADFDEKFLTRLEKQVGVPSNPDDPLLVGFARKLGVSAKLVRLACDKHAYRSTAMVRLLHHHREKNGVVRCDWARPILFRHGHPELWAALASVGRKTVFMEGAGVMAHYYMELAERKPLRDIRLYGCLVIMRRYLNLTIQQIMQQKGMPLPDGGRGGFI